MSERSSGAGSGEGGSDTAGPAGPPTGPAGAVAGAVRWLWKNIAARKLSTASNASSTDPPMMPMVVLLRPSSPEELFELVLAAGRRVGAVVGWACCAGRVGAGVGRPEPAVARKFFSKVGTSNP